MKHAANGVAVLCAALLSAMAAQAGETTPASTGRRLSEDGKTLWIDGSLLPKEGQGFADVAGTYQRMPDRIKAITNINIGVWKQGKCSAGQLFRFHLAKTSQLKVRWSLFYKELHGGNLSPIAKSGVDFYGWNAAAEEWRFGMSATPSRQDGNEKEFWVPGSGDVMLYLPLYNGVTKFEIGVGPNAEITPVKRRKFGIDKPIVFYGTSITQGGCVSRPGMAYPAVVSRRLDAPHVNLGFSGNGRMELEMVDFLTEIDASCYVLDCLWNMKADMVKERFEPFLRKLQAAKPDVPILTLEECVVENRPNAKSSFIRDVVARLKAEEPARWKRLAHIQAERLFFDDYEGTVDRCHPNDWGTMKMSGEITAELKKLLLEGK